MLLSSMSVDKDDEVSVVLTVRAGVMVEYNSHRTYQVGYSKKDYDQPCAKLLKSYTVRCREAEYVSRELQKAKMTISNHQAAVSRLRSQVNDSSRHLRALGICK